MSGAILIIAAMAGVMGWALAIEQIPTIICNFMLSLTDNGLIAMLLIQVFPADGRDVYGRITGSFNSGAGVPANHAGIRL